MYDVTNYDHPGGIDKFIKRAGTDWTDDFKKVGHKTAHLYMEKLKVGRYVDDTERMPSRKQNDEDENPLFMFFSIAAVLTIGFLGYKYMNSIK